MDIFTLFGRIVLDSSSAEKDLDRFESKTNDSQKTLRNFQKLALAAGAAITGTAMLIRNTFDEADATIRKSTGATGEAFESLKSDLRSVSRQTDASIGNVAVVIGELNTRLGSTGGELQDLTKLTLNFAKVTDQDAGAAASLLGKLINALGMEASDAESLMDKLTFASQQSGIAVGTLGQLILDAGPSFEELGFGLDRSIALFASFEAAGANPREVVSSLNLVLNQMARDGATNAEEAFNLLIASIKDAPNILAATTIASEAFGARVGAKVAEDIRAGRFEVDALAEAVANSGGTMQATAADIMTFRNQLSLWRNNLTVLLEPLGTVAPLLLGITTAVPGAMAAINGMRMAMAAFNLTLLANPIGLVIIAIVALIAAGVLLWKNWDWVTEKARALWGVISDTFTRIRNAIVGAIDSIDGRFAPFLILLGPLGAIAVVIRFRNEFVSAFEWIRDRVMPIIDAIRGAIDTVISAFQSIPDPRNLPGAGVVGGIAGGVRDLFRANGGPVSGGSPYIVGERGPELFVPGASGNIIPNEAMAPQVNLTFADGMGWLKDFVRVEIDRDTQWQQGTGARIAGGI